MGNLERRHFTGFCVATLAGLTLRPYFAIGHETQPRYTKDYKFSGKVDFIKLLRYDANASLNIEIENSRYELDFTAQRPSEMFVNYRQTTNGIITDRMVPKSTKIRKQLPDNLKWLPMFYRNDDVLIDFEYDDGKLISVKRKEDDYAKGIYLRQQTQVPPTHHYAVDTLTAVVQSLIQLQSKKPLPNELPIVGNKGKFNKATVISQSGLVKIITDNPQDQFESAAITIDGDMEPTQISIAKMFNAINIAAKRI